MWKNTAKITSMARPREFDTDDALSKAMDVFWKSGYADASLPDLLAGMNLTRGSLYKAFKDKKSLFLIVLGNYDDQAINDAVAALTDPAHAGWDRIFGMFDKAADAIDAGDNRGCLLCSAIAGPAVYDADISACATKALNRLRAGFEVALHDANAGANTAPLADFLITQYVGIMILSRTAATASLVRQNANAIRTLAHQ